MAFVHLHTHSHFSILEGLPKPIDYVKRAKEFWMESLALTDTGNLHWGHEFYKMCKSEGIKPIMWVEIFVQSSLDPKLQHKLVLLAKSLQWYRNIISLLTQWNLEEDEFSEGLRLDDIRELKKNRTIPPSKGGLGGDVPEWGQDWDLEIICLSWPITWEIPFYILSWKNDEQIVDRIKEYQEIFWEENYFLELLDHRDIPKQELVTNTLIELNKNFNIPVVACQNSYYITEEDKQSQDVIQALWTGHELENPDRRTLINGDYSFKSEEQMHELFWFIPEALENTVKIAKMCEIEFETWGILIPTFELPEEDQIIYEKALKKEENQYSPYALSGTFPPGEKGKVQVSPVGGDAWKAEGAEPIQKLSSAEWYLRYLSFKGLNWRFDYWLSEEEIFMLIQKIPGWKLEQSLQETLPDELRALSLTYYTDKKRKFLKTLTQEQQDYITRLEYELVVIHEMWFDGYFLIVADYINWARDNNIPVWPWRGSAAWSLMAFLSGITDLDPRKYGLIFERFLNPARISMPDIDTDFADTDRSRVIEYCRNKYGADKVVQICTFWTFAARAAVKDVWRVMGIPYQEMNELAKLIPEKPWTKLKWALEDSFEFAEAYEQNPVYKILIDSALKIEWNLRQLWVHACAVIIAPEPVTNFCPLQHPPKDQESIITQYSAYPLEDLGLLKMDFLWLRNLTIIKNTLKIIKNQKWEEFDILKIKLDEPEAFKIFADGDTTWVFQFESDGMRKYLIDLAPDTFEDLIAMVSLYRPWPLAYIPSFIERKYGREEVKYMTQDLTNILLEEKVSEEEIEVQKVKLEEDLKQILDVTYWIAVYQEQLMFIVQYMAWFSLWEADLLRRWIGKKKVEVIAALKKEFIEKWKDYRGYHPRVTQYIYEEMIQPAANYSFNKSHAACYAFIAYQTAYLKAFYRTEFLTAVMVSDEANMERIVMEVWECESNGIHILPPSVQESMKHFTYIDDENIRFGLKAIKWIGDGPIDKIIEARESPPSPPSEGGSFVNDGFKDLQDFVERCWKDAINKKSLEALIKSWAMDSFWNRGQMWESIPSMIDFVKKTEKEKGSSQIWLFASMWEEFEDKIELEQNFREFNYEDTLKWEKEMIGFSVSGHALDGLWRYCMRRSNKIKKLQLDFELLLEMDKKENPEKYKEPTLEEIEILSKWGEEAEKLKKEQKKSKWKRKDEPIQAVWIIADIRTIFTKAWKKMMFLKCEWFDYDFEVVVFPRDVEKFEEKIELDKFIIAQWNLDVNFEYNRKSVQVRDIKIVSITQVRDQAKDLWMMDDRKRVTAMYEIKHSPLLTSPQGRGIKEDAAILSPLVGKSPEGHRGQATEEIQEYTITIPSYAKKEDLQTLKKFLEEQKNWTTEVFINLKGQKISTKISVESLKWVQKWEKNIWG